MRIRSKNHLFTFLEHYKFMNNSGNGNQFPAILGMSGELSLTLTVFAEIICSVFILFGLGTRLAVIPLIITMLVAVLYIHSSDPF